MHLVTEGVTRQIFEIIKKDILERRIKPGERIDTKGIAEQYGISVMPVRNALQQLTSNGLVVNKERVGFFVKKFSQTEISDIMDVRMMFELYCLCNFYKRINLEKLKECLQRLQESPVNSELDQVDLELHLMIIKASENPFLIAQYEKLNSLFTVGLLAGSRENLELAREEHINILNSIENGQINIAVASLKQHLERAKQETIQLYKIEYAGCVNIQHDEHHHSTQ